MVPPSEASPSRQTGLHQLAQALRQAEAVEFDENGAPQPFHPEAELNVLSGHALVSGKALVELSAARICLIAVPFPPAKPVGVLSVRWREAADLSELPTHLATLQQIGELATTAFVNISLRQSMAAFDSARPRKG